MDLLPNRTTTGLRGLRYGDVHWQGLYPCPDAGEWIDRQPRLASVRSLILSAPRCYWGVCFAIRILDSRNARERLCTRLVGLLDRPPVPLSAELAGGAVAAMRGARDFHADPLECSFWACRALMQDEEIDDSPALSDAIRLIVLDVLGI